MSTERIILKRRGERPTLAELTCYPARTRSRRFQYAKLPSHHPRSNGLRKNDRFRTETFLGTRPPVAMSPKSAVRSQSLDGEQVQDSKNYRVPSGIDPRGSVIAHEITLVISSLSIHRPTGPDVLVASVTTVKVAADSRSQQQAAQRHPS